MVEPRKPTPRPKTKAAAKMLPKYKNLGVQKRMDEAVKLVMSGECSQAEAARNCGVTRPRLNERVKEAREKLADQQARSAATAAERRGEAPNTTVAHVETVLEGAALGLMQEVRRVPPFAEFDEMYFSSLSCFDCGVHHPTPAFHTEIMEAITDPAIKRLMINVPPGHSKSTVATVKSTIYELCRDPNSMTMIVSKSQGLAKKFLYQIQNYLTNPDTYASTPRNLIEDWGPFTDGTSTWSKEMFYVAGRQSAEKDPTVSAWGVGQHIYGVRAHRVIMDDIADLENQRNQERVKEMLEWCMQEPGSRVGRHGKLIYVGTRVNAGDIYSHLQDLSGYKVIRYPCIIDEDAKTTLWPDHYPFEAAALQRESMGSERWQLVYQNVDTPGFGASFPPEVVEATYDATRSLGQYNPNWALVAGLDPAGANSQSGYTAMILLGLDLDTGERHLIDLVNHKQMKAPQMRDQMFDWADRYPTLRELRVESNGLQALALDTPIPTPAGWTTMGEVAVGDQVFAPDGSATSVVAKSDVHQHGEAFTVTFSDGTNLVADAGHRWFVNWPSNGGTASGWTTTAELHAMLRDFPGAGRRSIPNTHPLELPEANLPIDPYLLGSWLGDGSSHAPNFASDPSNGDQAAQREMLAALGYETKTEYVDPCKTAVPALRAELKSLGLLNNKHIPPQYLRASAAQRLALLQGLMDTDGSIARNGRADFANQNQALIAGTYELLVSLGWRPTVWHGENISRVFFHPKAGDLVPFRLGRKAARIPAHTHTSRSTTHRSIVSIESVGECPVACIKVAHESSQFLAGRQMVPTGNSQLVQYNQEILTRLTSKGVRVVPHITTGRNKWDADFGVESMATMFINRQITLPTKDVASRNRIKPLVEQLTSFPMGAQTDLVMALWFTELGCRDIHQRAQLPMFDPRFKAPRRIMRQRRTVDFATGRVSAPGQLVDPAGRPMFPAPGKGEVVPFTNVAGSVRI